MDLNLGLSPRVRGNHQRTSRLPFSIGSIPACAGEPARCLIHRESRTVYPRVCGGTGIPGCRVRHYQGLSPRVRGNLPHPLPFVKADRSIPACAGGTALANAIRNARNGLSPRVRGNQGSEIPGSQASGSIPACAGNHSSQSTSRESCRSIPACAGEPHTWYALYIHLQVYPRVCGGTFRRFILSLAREGLSPRVRGTVLGPHRIGASRGLSPRVRGTAFGKMQDDVLAGLSPRVRGNRLSPPI